MRLSENSSVAGICEKFNSLPFHKAIKGQKIGKAEDVTLINTVTYEVRGEVLFI